GDVVLALPHDASFQLNAKVSEKHNIVSDFKLTYLSEPPPPPGARPRSPEGKPEKAPPAVKVQPPAKSGPIITPVPMEKPATVMLPYVLRRVNAICGSGDATISIASFGGTI